VLVGRSGELEQLDSLAESAQVGIGGRLVLVGDPGMGKTTLLRAADRHARRRGVPVVRVCAADGQAELELSLLEDLLRKDSGLQRALLADRPRTGPRLALEFLEHLVQRGPALLIIDDAHLADLASLRALRMAVERRNPAPLGIVLATRPNTPTAALLNSWPNLVLGPLERDASRAVLRAALGPDYAAAPLDQVADALHGHPLLLTSAGSLLTADQISGRAPIPDPIPVPAALVTAWAPTLDRLGPPAQNILLDLAVSGGRMDLLSAMADRRESLADGLDRCVLSGVVELSPTGSPGFGPPALRDVVLARTAAAQRRRAHRRAARAAQELGLSPGVIVDHLSRSVSTADDATASAIATQAERAERSEHYAVAARAWEAAARMTTSPTDRVSFAVSAIRVSFDFGIPASEGLLQIASDARLDPHAAAQLAGIRAEQRADLDPEAALPAILEWVELAAVGSPELMPTLLLEAVGIALQLGDSQTALQAAQRYAGLDPQGATYLPRPDPPWTTDAVLAGALFQSGDVARAMPLRRAAIDAAGATDPRSMDLSMLMSTIGIDDFLLDISPEASNRLLVAAERAGEDSGLLPYLYAMQAWRAKARVDWQTARAFLLLGRPAAEAAGLIQPLLGMTALSVELAAQCGDDEGLRTDVQRLREAGSRGGNRRRLATLDRALGLRELVHGHLGDAITWLSSAADVGFLGRGLRDAVLPARVDLIEALVRSGESAQAAARYAPLHALLCDIGDPLATALDERAAALVTQGGEAEAHFRDALVAHARAGEPFEEARTLLLMGEHLRRERRKAEARAVLQRAVHTFDRLGATPWSARASQELRASGGLATSRSAATVLTAQERAVALAVAGGANNREVAEALFLSPRTVEYHLGNVYRKLEVHGRGALARALDPLPAPSPTFLPVPLHEPTPQPASAPSPTSAPAPVDRG